MGGRLAGVARVGVAPVGVELAISWILDRWTRGPGVDFPYGLGCSGRFPTLCFLIHRFFKKSVFDFEGGLEIGVIPKVIKHAIPLWFSRVSHSFDRHLFQKTTAD